MALVVNTSSNLRLRSGIAPVAAFLRAGIEIGLGVDNMAIDDDDDGLRELRLAHYVHDGVDYEDSGLTWRRALRAAGEAGQRIVTGRRDIGRLRAGDAADFVVLDYARLAADALEDGIDALALTLGRATAADVRELVVAGRRVVSESRLVSFDLAAARAELSAQARQSIGRIVEERTFLADLRRGVKSFFDSGAHRGAS